MPSLRVDKKPSGTYLSLVQSYRDDEGKSRMRTIANLGKVEDFQIETLKRLGARLHKLAGGDPGDLVDNDMKELARFNFGYVQIVDKLTQYFGLDAVCERIKRKHRLGFDLCEAMRLMVIERLNEPCSKLASYENQGEYYGLEKMELHWLYRALDKLDLYSDTIQEHIFKKGRHLFNQKLDIVFYDVTTFYFDSQVEREDELRQKGFGKDGKIGKTQIVFGLLIDKHKQPVGYQIFDGKKFEGHTLRPVLEKLKKRYSLDRIVVVADRGMLSKANIELVSEELGMSYIFGERLKATPRLVQDVFLDKSKYNKEWIYKRDGQKITVSYYSVWYGDRRIIGTYSEKRARKDKHERELRITKAKELLKKPSSLGKKARYHYLSKKQGEEYKLNEEKIKRAELFDGILAISTNIDENELSDIQVMDQYKHLFKIEQSFRTMKSILEVRPMFHWTDKRIKGHICMCFISLAMLRNIELRLNKAGYQWSERKILKTLDMMQVSQLIQNENHFFLRSKIEEDQEILTNVFKLKKVKPMTHKTLNIR